ncbi:TatD family hydrolase [Phanerochaete sordida]|uniref:TatD family hydrolase n=1 Tax=Phanerochaete sordida TaxID=48140 RepID=A0A9P3GRI2_9APHY|nr:TatD family hydrolase [Phanerochaete sordida]
MGKKKNSTPGEEHLLLPVHPSRIERPETEHEPTVDTHTHLLSTFSAYQSTYKPGKHPTIWDFVRNMYHGRRVEAIVDVWCEGPVVKQWKELADSALTAEQREKDWGGMEYWFVMGVHPHEAKNYNDAVEQDILEAMKHPRCVGWGEMGLDYHYDNSPREIQQEVFTRQLRQAVKLGKPLTIHTREAEEDTERILKAEVPKDHRIHIHCFTDSPEWAARMLEHFPNLFIGITGVITYSSNLNTAAVIREMARAGALRIVLETDAPFMVPGNIYGALPEVKGKRLPLCHTAMLPWTAEFVARVANEAGGEWDVESVMRVARENARKMYGI